MSAAAAAVAEATSLNMKKKVLLALLEKLDFHPGKGLGQNFLIDANLLDFIIKSAKPAKGELLLEAGPGFGVLTRGLLEKGAEVTAIEFDHRICEYLRENMVHPRFTLVEGDACRVNLEELVDGRDFRAVANLPYSISSIFIARLLELPNPPLSMCFMLQKEMAMRMAADKTISNYGALSVRAQIVYDVEIIRNVPPQVFHPAPEVESAVVYFKRKDEFPDVETRKKVFRMVKLAFSQKRKQMAKPLSACYPKEKIIESFRKLGYREDLRPHQLDPLQYVTLYRELAQYQISNAGLDIADDAAAE